MVMRALDFSTRSVESEVKNLCSGVSSTLAFLFEDDAFDATLASVGSDVTSEGPFFITLSFADSVKTELTSIKSSFAGSIKAGLASINSFVVTSFPIHNSLEVSLEMLHSGSGGGFAFRSARLHLIQ
jgi:hypothetical protein